MWRLIMRHEDAYINVDVDERTGYVLGLPTTDLLDTTRRARDDQRTKRELIAAVIEGVGSSVAATWNSNDNVVK